VVAVSSLERGDLALQLNHWTLEVQNRYLGGLLFSDWHGATSSCFGGGLESSLGRGKTPRASRR